MTRLDAGAAYDAHELALQHAPVPRDQLVSGDPTTGSAVLEQHENQTVGIWEMTPGAMRDIEADEVFVVLSGRATVEFIEPPLDPVALSSGTMVRLRAGMQTVWTVEDTVRKLYVAP